jgi:hypothetical protein
MQKPYNPTDTRVHSFIHTCWTQQFVPTSGTLYKRRRHFFSFFDTPILHVGNILILSVGRFQGILTPPPSKLPTSFMDSPSYIVLLGCVRPIRPNMMHIASLQDFFLLFIHPWSRPI